MLTTTGAQFLKDTHGIVPAAVDISEAAVDLIASDCEQCVVESDDANHAAVVLRALRRALTAEAQQAARYRWLAQRIEVSPSETMSGKIKDAMDFKIGQSVMATRPRPPCDTSSLDSAIDAILAKGETK